MNSVIKGAGYVLVHTPDMVLHNGTTQTTEQIVNPESEYLKELPSHIRSYEDVVAYHAQPDLHRQHDPGRAGRSIEQPWVRQEHAKMPSAMANSARSCPRMSSCC